MPILLLMLLAGTTFGAVEPLTWDACVRRALEANPELSAAQGALRSAEFAAREPYSGFLPKLSAELGYTREAPVLGVAGTVGENFGAALRISQNLFSGLADLGRVDEARAKREFARAGLDATRARLSAELKTIFAGLSFAQKNLEFAKTIVGRREANSKLVAFRYESGRENKGSLLLSQAYLEGANLDALQAQNALIVSRAELARIIGLNGSAEESELSVTGSVPVEKPPTSFEVDSLVKSTPEFRQAEAKEQETDALVGIASSPFFPRLDITGAATTGAPRFFPTQNEHWTVGVALVFPLFDGGKDYHATRAAIETHKAASLTRENALRAGAAKLKQALAGFVEGVRRLEVNRTFVEAVATRAKIAAAKYNNGLMSFEDWDVIENDYIGRQKAFLQSERDRIAAEASWEQAQGKGVFK